MKIIQLILISTGLLCSKFARAQSEEALLFSQTNLTPSARFQAIGGAGVSIGGDLSSAFANPAGLGFYNRSEFSFTPAINFYDTDASYFGTTTNDFKTKFSLNDIGVVFNRPQDDIVSGGFKGGSFAISFARTGDFNNRLTYENSQPQVDFFSYILPDLNDGVPNEFADLAFNAFLADEFIDQIIGTDTTYVFAYVAPFFDSNGDFFRDANGNPDIYPDLPLSQSETIDTKGSQYQFSLAYGANFDDRFYIGASLGFLSLDYTKKRIYREVLGDIALNDFTLTDELNIEGSGINFTLGAIFRPINQLTLGLSFLSPTFYNLSESNLITIDANFNQYQYSSTLTLENEIADIEFISDYTLRTPWKLTGGVTYFLGKYGFITGNVEVIDYTKNRISSDDFEASNLNRIINDDYESVVNFQIGSEFRHKIFRLRAGYAKMGDTLKGGLDASRTNISFGTGIRLPKFFIDIGFVNSVFDSTASPFTLADGTAPTANIDNKRFSAIWTLGFNF